MQKHSDQKEGGRHIHKSQLHDLQLNGMVVTTKPRRTHKPKVYTRASECVSYFNADKSDATLFTRTRTRTRTRNKRTVTPWAGSNYVRDHRPEVARYAFLPTFNLTED